MKSQNLTRTITRSLLTIVIIFTLNIASEAQYFFKAYDFPTFSGKKEIGFSLQRETGTNGGANWSIAGFTNCSHGAGSTDWTLLRLDKFGNLLKSVIMGFSGTDSCYSHTLLNINNYNYALAGMFTYPVTTNPKASFMLLNSNMNSAITYKKNSNYESIYRQVISYFPDTTIGLTGYSQDTTNSRRKIIASCWKLKDPSFNSYNKWRYLYKTGTNSSEDAFSICNASTNSTASFAITGTTNYYRANKKEVFVTRLNEFGVPIWTYIYHHSDTAVNSESRKIIQTPNKDGFIIIGWTNAQNLTSSNIWIFKINNSGVPQWSYVYMSTSYKGQGNSIIFSSDGNLTFTGTMINSSNNENGMFCKINYTTPNVILGQEMFDNRGYNDRGYDLSEYTSTEFAFTGLTTSKSTSAQDISFIRSSFSGQFVNNCLKSLTLNAKQENLTTTSMALTYITYTDSVISPTLKIDTARVDTLCSPLTSSNENNSTVPTDYTLKQNYPNPFNPTTNIEYGIPNDGFVSLKVYDITGKEVMNLVNENKTKGSYLISFNANELTSGVYFYKLESGIFTQTRKMTLIK